MRTVETLPKNAQQHYKHSIRQAFNSHMDEDDPERLEQIYSQAVRDAEWLQNKYKVKKDLTAEHDILKKGETWLDWCKTLAPDESSKECVTDIAS